MISGGPGHCFIPRLPELVKNWSNLELPSPWPSEDDIKILTEKAAGLFILQPQLYL